jgi:hypothetical protein
MTKLKRDDVVDCFLWEAPDRGEHMGLWHHDLLVLASSANSITVMFHMQPTVVPIERVASRPRLPIDAEAEWTSRPGTPIVRIVHYPRDITPTGDRSRVVHVQYGSVTYLALDCDLRPISINECPTCGRRR